MDEPQSPPPAFPVWAIAIIAALVVVLIAITLVFWMKKRRSRSLSDDTTTYKKTSLSSLTASLIPTQPTTTTTTTTTTTATTANTTTHTTTHTNTNTPRSNEKTDKVASHIDESDDPPPPEAAQEIKFSLPLPPPSTSFFSDKMELDGENGQDFYDVYLNSKKQDNDFVSIDVDNAPSFYSNVQQKAATIKSTLRQSIRVKQKSNKNSALQLFSDDNQSKNSVQDSNVIVPLKETIINMNPLEATQPPPPQEINIITQSTSSASIKSESDGSPITPNLNLQEPVKAAKRVIRSASRKTKTRSMAIPDLADLPDELNDKNPRTNSVRYASIRGPKNNGGEHMTITSGSMRRLVRESVLFDEDSLPLPSSAAMNSLRTPTPSSSASSTKKSVADIADWWETPKTTTASQNHLPLNITSGVDSISSNTPTQYRASLTASIFANTLSKASAPNASVFIDAKDESSSISRHSSFRRGTLGRNTLRSITATATNGVNRSLKGLFDYSSSTSVSNKVVPDDSQKMELDSGPTSETVVDEAQPYKSIRQKSTSGTNIRPTFLKPSESSTKYALADDDYCKSTAQDDNTTQPEPTTALPRKHHELPAGSNKIEATPSRLLADKFAKDSTSNTPTISTTHKGEVDTIRRMLQDTWITNMKESPSNYSMLSEAESVASPASTESKSTPHQQQQSFLSKSLLTQQVAKRASLLARHNADQDFIPLQGPAPSASFSSSTVRTMVATNEPGNINSEPISIRQNLINKMNGSNKVQESSSEDNPTATSRFSTSPMTITSAVSSPRNSSADSSRGHSRKSSAGNSSATALRISIGYSNNAKTWNGRGQRRTSKASVMPQEMISPEGSLTSNNKKFFSTMRKGQKSRGNIPWMMEEEFNEKTPAQIERDRYLEGGRNL